MDIKHGKVDLLYKINYEMINATVEFLSGNNGKSNNKDIIELSNFAAKAINEGVEMRRKCMVNDKDVLNNYYNFLLASNEEIYEKCKDVLGKRKISIDFLNYLRDKALQLNDEIDEEELAEIEEAVDDIVEDIQYEIEELEEELEENTSELAEEYFNDLISLEVAFERERLRKGELSRKTDIDLTDEDEFYD